MLQDSQAFVTNIYRPFMGEFIDDSESEEEESGDSEEKQEDVETPDSRCELWLNESDRLLSSFLN